MEKARATIQHLASGVLRAVVSTADLDRDGRIVHQDGWELDNYRLNPVVMWNHEYLDGAKAFPIGRAAVDVIDGQLVADITWADTPDAKVVESLYDQGILTSFSAGWNPLEDVVEGEDGTAHHIRQELMEFSAVPIPSNPSARVLVAAAIRGATIASPGEAEGGVASPEAVPPEPVSTPPPVTPVPVATEGTSSNAVDVTVTVNEEAAELLAPTTNRTPAVESAVESAPAAEEANGEGSAPEQASGLTTRQQVERAATVTAQIADAMYRRLTGRLPD